METIRKINLLEAAEKIQEESILNIDEAYEIIYRGFILGSDDLIIAIPIIVRLANKGLSVNEILDGLLGSIELKTS